MGAQSSTVEGVAGEIARGQHGVVTRGQLLAVGITRKRISTLLRKGALLRAHPGVYRVGHRAPSVEATYMAAVLAAGHGAVLSGRAAAHLLGLIKGSPPPPEVISPTQRIIRGVRTRRSPATTRVDVTSHRAIPVTTVPRTLVDLASVLEEDALARACHEAGVRYGTTPSRVEEVLERRPSSPGARKLRRVIHGDVRVTLSALERRFLELLRSQELALPETNRPAGGRRVDCRWPEQRLTVELDSYRYHGSRHAWEADRNREREAFARGDDFRRYTWGDVFERPDAVIRELSALLPRCAG